MPSWVTEDSRGLWIINELYLLTMQREELCRQKETLLNLSTFAQYEYPNNCKTACLNDLCTKHLVMNNCLIGYEGHVES